MPPIKRFSTPKTGREKAVVRIRINIGATIRVKPNSHRANLPWFSAVHQKTANFNVNSTWIEGFRKAFGVELDAEAYSVRRLKPTDLKHHLNEKIYHLISEYNHCVGNMYKVCLVENFRLSQNSQKQNIPVDPQVFEEGADNDIIVESEEEDDEEAIQDDEDPLALPPVLHPVKINVDRHQGSQPAQNNTKKHKGLVYEDYNSDNANVTNYQEDDDEASNHSQNSQIDCEEIGIEYNVNFKNELGKRLHQRFTNGQMLRFHNAMSELQNKGKLLRWTMAEPLLVTFLRELFEV